MNILFSSMSFKKLTHLSFKLCFYKIMFCVQHYWKWTHWWCYNLYFEHQKGYHSKKHHFLKLSFAENAMLNYPWTYLSWSLWGPQQQSIRSPLSPCDYKRVFVAMKGSPVLCTMTLLPSQSKLVPFIHLG